MRVAEDFEIDVVLCERLTVLPETKLLKPDHNLLHGSASRISWQLERLPNRDDRTLRSATKLVRGGAARSIAARNADHARMTVK